ncbi:MULTISPECIES: MTH1187 family thiamine-binding protein [Limnochorda]|uniref:MTH1187 family thiamine-binding protein n=1 Tax=Limnochorda TaxID=1676651 RepID=UPI0017D69DFF|nr:MTH1187 family thiamine-binding protein [Limnochorda pilosa]MBO2486392.1 thiamine-binding protein [Bacillota bacterium]MBO2518755.1 thiamine-binding protein [Bacillota bacterium]NMA70421.1 MTH1187 family thiamine-binding protein [Bacillota bacterium]
MAIAAVSITPLGTGTTSVAPYVAAAERALREEPGLRVELNAMFTLLEGDLDAIFRAIRRAQEAVVEAGAQRVSTVIKIDDRRDRVATMEEKVARVEQLLQDG